MFIRKLGLLSKLIFRFHDDTKIDKFRVSLPLKTTSSGGVLSTRVSFTEDVTLFTRFPSNSMEAKGKFVSVILGFPTN